MHRITTAVLLTPEELTYLKDYLRPKNDATRDVKQMVERINSAAASALTNMRSELPWTTRGANDEPVDEILTNTWIRGCETAELRMAQSHQRKGFLVHIVRNPELAKGLKSRDFICEVNQHQDLSVSQMVEGLENYLKTGQIRLGIYREGTFQIVSVDPLADQGA